jgi:hypothetical protein
VILIGNSIPKPRRAGAHEAGSLCTGAPTFELVTPPNATHQRAYDLLKTITV